MQDILRAVDKNRTLILEAERYIWANPETGYKEYKTSAYMAEQFEKLGYTLHMAEGITGFYTTLDTGKEGPTVLVLGELDSIICPGHAECDKTTGAVHSCGHNAQCAALLGIAAALKELLLRKSQLTSRQSVLKSKSSSRTSRVSGKRLHGLQEKQFSIIHLLLS